ncbi:MAG TPA: DNA repair protein RecN, partial [Cyanobacteria bacterium UBA9579]|nr:DNA repair protein RecN [Cyanobacteria bacterium UBA9579]
IKIDLKEDISNNGIDNVEFLISPNPGEPLKPLAKIASGGEISRVMLAIKTIFARADQVNTVIFDEIDSGISGKTSQAIAEELADLAKSHQILCITHQPIIAAMADEYFYIEKIQANTTTSVTVHNLNKEHKIIAISKLASGSQDQDSINFAAKLTQQATEYKNSYKESIKVN